MRWTAAISLVVLAAVAIVVSPGHMIRYFPWPFYIPMALLPLGLLLAAWRLINSEAPPSRHDPLDQPTKANPSLDDPACDRGAIFTAAETVLSGAHSTMEDLTDEHGSSSEDAEVGV